MVSITNGSEYDWSSQGTTTKVFNVQSTLLNGRTVYAILYIQIRLFVFIHALCNRCHTTFPNKHMKEQVFSHDCNRTVRARGTSENKTHERSLATATQDWDTYGCE
ncbi:Atypical Kinase Coq8A [Manis pentadactyla]|nr:Atypical Kinase Coq8A [Manis pentadactyla]